MRTLDVDRLKTHLVKTKRCRPSQCEADGFRGTSRNGLRAAVEVWGRWR
jgi:hypothetical protein